MTGTVAVANANDGVLIQSGAHNNTIGGNAAGTGNVISGNTTNGIEITGSGTNSNTVAGNYVGTNGHGQYIETWEQGTEGWVSKFSDLPVFNDLMLPPLSPLAT